MVSRLGSPAKILYSIDRNLQRSWKTEALNHLWINKGLRNSLEMP